MNDSPIPLPQRLLAEGLGTAILVATVVGPSVWPAGIKQSLLCTGAIRS
jgi:hypothetical protein